MQKQLSSTLGPVRKIEGPLTRQNLLGYFDAAPERIQRKYPWKLVVVYT